MSDEFVQLNAPIVLRCQLASSDLAASRQEDDQDDEQPQAAATRLAGQPEGGPQHQQKSRQTIEWFTSDGLQVSPTWPSDSGQLQQANKGR